MRTLVLSIGNTSLFCGIFVGEKLTSSFRLPPARLIELPGRARGRIERVVLCSVVPALTPDVQRLIRRVWSLEAHILTADSSHGLDIRYRNPRELGADRVAAALGARALFPRKNVIVVDCGTATTVTALHRDGAILGGAIFPGAALWPRMLATRTAQLPTVSLRRPRDALGRSPKDAIASGIFFGQVGAIRETVARVQAEAFPRSTATILGTGGNAPLFASENVFAHLEPALALQGLHAFSHGTSSINASSP